MKVLWIAAVWPEATSSAAGFRTIGLFDALMSAGYELRVSSPCSTNRFQTALEEKGIRTACLPPNEGAFDQFVRDYAPEFVIFDRFMIEEQFGWRVKKEAPRAVRILDTVDLHSLRRLREAKVRRGENPLILSGEELLNETAIRELSAIYRSDLAIMVSRYEIELLRDRYGVPERLLALNGFRYPAPSVAVPSYGDRRDIAAIGNFNHPPNHDSFRILHEEIWPRIRRRLDERGLRGVELHIYGAYPTRDLMARDNAQTGFRVRGPAVDAIETLSRYRLNVAPLRFGAGIKGKVADGWAAGTPCIATSIAAEGMKSGEAFGGVIADSWEEFAQAACELYESPESWTDAQQTGWKVLRDEFDSDANATSFLATLAEVVAQRDARRATNPVGHMLWHHRCRSVEYFSRWIEAKNRAR